MSTAQVSVTYAIGRFKQQLGRELHLGVSLN